MAAAAFRDYLTPLARLPKRKKFCVFDIESKRGNTQKAGFTRPFLVGFYDGQKFTSWRNEKPRVPQLADEVDFESVRAAIEHGGCVDRFFRYFLTPRYSGWNCYAHNGGGFDFLHLVTWIKEHRREGYRFKIIPVQSSIQKMVVWLGKKKKTRLEWNFLDSFRLLPMGLDRAAKSFGLSGKRLHDLNMKEECEAWEEYLKVDCEQLFEVLVRAHDMIEEKLGGDVGITTPSTAMGLIRRHLKKAIPRHQHFAECKHSPERAEEAEQESGVRSQESGGGETRVCLGCLHDWVRRGYYGGRTEIFRMEGKNLHYYDINSSYAASMTEPMPVGEKLEDFGKIDWKLRASHVGFAEVEVEIPPECEIPPLPFRKDGKLMFPTGGGKYSKNGEKFEGVWDVDELTLLEDPIVNGKILRVGKVVWFRAEAVFKGFVEELWLLRDKNRPEYDEGLDQLAKLIVNAGYGKFAMDPDKEELVHARDTDDAGDAEDGSDNDDAEMGDLTLGEPGSDVSPSVVGFGCFLCGASCERGLCESCRDSKPASGDPESMLWYRKKRVDAPYVIPQVAAHITTLSRIRLWKMMREVVLQGKHLYYSDSVTGDRPLVVKNPDGHVTMILASDLWEKATREATTEGKEYATLEGWTALARREGSDGFFPIRKIMRHASGKTTWRISTKHGQTQVTSDHGIMVDGVEMRPEDFVKNVKRFTTLCAPVEPTVQRIDLMDYLKDTTIPFKAEGDRITLEKVVERGEHLWARRYYEQGTPEFSALIRVLAAYVSDGSSSLVGITTKTRYMFSLCKANIELMNQLHDDLLVLMPDVKLFGPFWSDTVYVLRSGTKFAAAFFAALCGYKCKGKRLPAFMYGLTRETVMKDFVPALANGDGHVDAAGQLSFTTTAPLLVSGISYVWSQHGQEHGFSFRPSKCSWDVRTRPTGSERNRYSIRAETFEPSMDDEFVYDLTVDGAHTFVDGIGRVLLHNTDSVMTDAEMPSSKLLGAFKDEYPGETLNGIFLQPKVYMLKKQSPFKSAHDAGCTARFEHLPTCASEACAGCACAGCATWKVAAKGIPPAERTLDNVKILRAGAAVIAQKNRMTEMHAREVIRLESRRDLSTKERTAKIAALVLEYRERSRELDEEAKRVGTVKFERLEKIRSLARVGFSRPPRMVDVKKRLVSVYDKRIILPDGISTRAVVLGQDGPAKKKRKRFDDEDLANAAE